MLNHKKVIPFPLEVRDEPEGWRFFDYLEGESNPIEAWYQSLSEEGQFVFDSLLKAHRKASSPTEWNGCKFLQGECRQYRIWEWCFFADGRQQRLLGMFADERKKAIFLIGCYHKQKRYTPADCLNTAVRRAKDVQKGVAKLSERTVKNDI